MRKRSEFDFVEIERAVFRCPRCGSLHRWRKLLLCLESYSLSAAASDYRGKVWETARGVPVHRLLREPHVARTEGRGPS